MVPDAIDLRQRGGDMVSPEFDGHFECCLRVDLQDCGFDLVKETLVVEVFHHADHLAYFQGIRIGKVCRTLVIGCCGSDPIDAVAAGNGPVVLMLVPYEKGDQQGGGQPEGQTGDIYNGEAPAAAIAR